MKKAFYFLITVTCLVACHDTVDPAWTNDIVLINSFHQEITVKLYWSLRTFHIKPGQSYLFRQPGSDGPSLDFDDSDSIIVTFADGKKKTDYNCSDQAVAAVVKNCSKDTVSLFNSFCYTAIKNGEHHYTNYYRVTASDYNEAR